MGGILSLALKCFVTLGNISKVSELPYLQMLNEAILYFPIGLIVRLEWGYKRSMVWGVPWHLALSWSDRERGRCKAGRRDKALGAERVQFCLSNWLLCNTSFS